MSAQLKASLPMYDLPELSAATSAFWIALRAALIGRGIGDLQGTELPEKLQSRYGEAAIAETQHPLDTLWLSEQLLFSQTCGYPYVTRLRERVTLIGTPDYGLIDNQAGWYDSVIVVRSDDPRDGLLAFQNARFAFNSLDSQSGCQAMMFLLATDVGQGIFFGRCVASGSHAASIRLVARGEADIAAIDGISWRFAQRYNPDARRLRVMMRTEPTPGLPYVCSRRFPGGDMASAVEVAIRRLPRTHARALGLRGLWRSSPTDYEPIAKRADVAASTLTAHLPVMKRLSDA